MKKRLSSDESVPYIYIFIYAKFKEQAYNRGSLSNKEVMDLMAKFFYSIPRSLYYHILTQMEYYDLIKRVHKLKYEIKIKDYPKNIDKVDDDKFKKIIKSINYGKKVYCEDDSFYRIIPNNAAKELKKLNCWIMN